MKFMNILAQAENAVEQAAPQLFFEPMNFVTYLKYMGIGMLVIFVVIGIIVLTTMLINKVFAE